jgi:hypothetical protein
VPRYFSLLEAEALLPSIALHLERLQAFKQQHEAAEQQLLAITQRITVAGGMLPPRAQMLDLRRERETSARGLKDTVEAIHATGCQLKDVEMGLIDFPTLYHGKEVYLCWKRGEDSITFWHEIEAGYRGRRPIDSEFLSNHRGDLQT